MTIFITLTAILFIFVIWHAAIDAKREAMFYHLMNNPGHSYDRSVLPWKGDEHNLFTEQRILMLIPLVISANRITGYWLVELLLVTSAILIWYVIHEGMYYLYRNQMNPDIYKQRFWSDNIIDPDEVPTFSKSQEFRVIALCLGCGLLGYAIILEIALS